MSSLSIFDIKAAQSTFLAKSDVSIPVACFKSDFVAQWSKSNSTLFCSYCGYMILEISSIYITKSFLSIQLLNELSKPSHLTYI